MNQLDCAIGGDPNSWAFDGKERVVRAGAGLGVVLDAERGHVEALEPLDDVVVQAESHRQ